MIQNKRCRKLTHCWCNIRLFGPTFYHVEWQDTVWNLLGLCSSSISSSHSRSSSINSCSSSSTSKQQQQLPASGVGLQQPAMSIQQRQDRAGLIRSARGRSAGQEGISWVLVDCLMSYKEEEKKYFKIHQRREIDWRMNKICSRGQKIEFCSISKFIVRARLGLACNTAPYIQGNGGKVCGWRCWGGIGCGLL